MVESSVVVLFILVALGAGWCLGYWARRQQKEPAAPAYPAPEQMKHRLQLLFDSYNDEAIDQFIHSLEVRPDTLALHISIGRHFRTEGEVDRAILVHQNLMAHPELSDRDSEPVIYELAKDYRTAGLYDRAEALLMQLRGSKQYGLRSRKLLLDIYERAQDWEDAVATAQQIDFRKHRDVSLRTAFYWCEIADRYIRSQNIVDARTALRKALSADRGCVRAYLMLAEIDMATGDYAGAIKQLKQVASIGPEYLVLALPMLHTCSRETDSMPAFYRYLDKLYRDTGQVQIRLAHVAALLACEQQKAATRMLEDMLQNKPDLAAAKQWLALQQEAVKGVDTTMVNALLQVIETQDKARPAYQCGNCGYAGEVLHWLCPSCRRWQTTKPRLEYIAPADTLMTADTPH